MTPHFLRRIVAYLNWDGKGPNKVRDGELVVSLGAEHSGHDGVLQGESSPFLRTLSRGGLHSQQTSPC